MSRQRHTLPVVQMEFHEGGNSIWIHGPDGGTVLRIQTRGKIVVDSNCSAPSPHGDIVVQDDIRLCVKAPRRRSKKPAVVARPDGTIDGVFDAQHVAAAFGLPVRRTRSKARQR